MDAVLDSEGPSANEVAGSVPPPQATADAVLRWHAERVFAETGRNKSATARRLGVDRKTLYRWLRMWETAT